MIINAIVISPKMSYDYVRLYKIELNDIPVDEDIPGSLGIK